MPEDTFKGGNPNCTFVDGVWRIDPVFGLAAKQVFDIYIAGARHGSRRTQQRCLEYLRRKDLDVGT